VSYVWTTWTLGPSISTFHGLSVGKIVQPESVVPTPTMPPGTPPTVAPELELLVDPELFVDDVEEDDDDRDDEVEDVVDDDRDDEVEDVVDAGEDEVDDVEEKDDREDDMSDAEKDVDDGDDDAREADVDDEANVEDDGVDDVGTEEVVSDAPPVPDCPLAAEPAVVDPVTAVPEMRPAPAPPLDDSAPWPPLPAPLPPLHAASSDVTSVTIATPNPSLFRLQLTMANVLSRATGLSVARRKISGMRGDRLPIALARRRNDNRRPVKLLSRPRRILGSRRS
jgi:hypothetical protein